MIAPVARGIRFPAAAVSVVVCAGLLAVLPRHARAQLGIPVDDAGAMVAPDRVAASTEGAGQPGLAAPAERPRATGFRDRQLRYPRVLDAYEEKAEAVDSLLAEAGVDRVAELYLRVFKRERLVEVWAREDGDRRFSLVRSYPVCKLSGRLGPKRREGDGQVPEGFYSIDLFNPWSDYHLSMRVDYPNAVDRARGSRGPAAPLGGDIFIHGGCATVGCVPITDESIEELYLIGVEARHAGQRRIPVHIFPTRLDRAGMAWLGRVYGRTSPDYMLWLNLRQGYTAFERTRTLPSIGTDGDQYIVVPELRFLTPSHLGSRLR